MAYTNVSSGRPGWPADSQVYTHHGKAHPAVVARAATADRTDMLIELLPSMPALYGSEATASSFELRFSHESLEPFMPPVVWIHPVCRGQHGRTIANDSPASDIYLIGCWHIADWRRRGENVCCAERTSPMSAQGKEPPLE